MEMDARKRELVAIFEPAPFEVIEKIGLQLSKRDGDMRSCVDTIGARNVEDLFDDTQEGRATLHNPLQVVED